MRQARDTDARAAATHERSVLPPATAAGGALRGEAAALESRADGLQRSAIRDRRLKSFTWIQRAALFLAFAGGFLWAAGAHQRINRRFVRHAHRAEATYGSARGKFIALASTNERSVLLSGAEPSTPFDVWCDTAFDRLFGPLSAWCSSADTPSPVASPDLAADEPATVTNLNEHRPPGVDDLPAGEART